MKFLIDQQLPPAPADFFRERGCESRHVLDLGMESSSDAGVFEFAKTRGFIIVTKDVDFLYLSRRMGSEPGLLWVRIGNCRTAVLLGALGRQWKEVVRCFEAGDSIVEIR